MFYNIVIGKPLIEPWILISNSGEEWEQFDRRSTLFTDTRFLPAVLAEAGIAKSGSEVHRNRKELVKNLDTPDCFWTKWGKQKIYIIVGE